MKIFALLLYLFLITTIFPAKAQAIILLPAVILIPAAKIVAAIIASLTLPVAGVSSLWAKLFNKPKYQIVIISLLTLAVVAILLFAFLRIQNPDRPLI